MRKALLVLLLSGCSHNVAYQLEPPMPMARPESNAELSSWGLTCRTEQAIKVCD
jgi:hypothetical protein